jgi:hypothetical protein
MLRSAHLSSPILLGLLAGCAGAPQQPVPAPEYALTHQELLPLAEQNHAYRWLNIMQQVAGNDVERFGARPPVLSRQMAIWATAMFDAWAAYDDKAVGTRLGGTLRRPAAERTLANKNRAIAYASYRALLFVYEPDAAWLRAQMLQLGYDPSDTSTDPSTPQGIGNLAAAAVLAFRQHDGSNQFGDEPGSTGGPYSDYTGYEPVNTVETIVDPDRWQPIAFTRPDGTKFTPGFLTPHWYRVRPFALESAEQFRAEPVPLVAKDPARLKAQTDAVLAYNRSLSPEQKAVVEFMRDGPRSTGQSGHWLRFAQDVSRRDHNDLDADVKLYFTVANAALDAFIACWETKRYYDSSRPWTLVRWFYRGQKVVGWAGPDGGTAEVPAEQWYPYSPYVFVTPPFPGYTSGHATVSGACSKMLELFTGSDRYGAKEVRSCCVLTEKKSGGTVTLDLPTFSATAEMAALSRAMGGYHIPIDNDVGLRIGRELAVWSWPRYRAWWEGTATVRP